MGFVQCDPERRDLGQTLLFTGPIVGLKSVVDAPASCKIRLQWPFPHFHMFDSPLGLTTDSFYHLSVTIIMTLQETDPLTLRRRVRPNLSWVRAAEAGGQGASCCCGGQSGAVDCGM